MVAGSVELVVVVLQLMHGGGILALLDLLVETSLERRHRSSEASELFFELLLCMGDGWFRSKLGGMGGWVFGSRGMRTTRSLWAGSPPTGCHTRERCVIVGEAAVLDVSTIRRDPDDEGTPSTVEGGAR